MVQSEHFTQPLTQNQFDALVSFTFNEGPGKGEYGAPGFKPGLSNSNVLDAVNASPSDPKQVVTNLNEWILPLSYPGLVTRRAEEGAMYSEGNYNSTH